MRFLVYTIVSLAAGISLTAIASAVLPTTAALSVPALIVIGVVAAAVGFAIAFGPGLLFGIIATALAAFLLVFLYDRLAPKIR